MALRNLLANCLRMIFNTACLQILMMYAAIRWLITSILYLFEPLSRSRFRRQTRIVPSSQSQKLRRCHEELRKLINIRKQADEFADLFVALDVAFMDEPQQTITAIGLSHQSPVKGSNLASFHWIIGNPQNLGIGKASFEDGLFLYGNTQAIQATDIGPSLQHVFSNLASRYQQIYLIAHDVEAKLERLSKHWVAPDGFIALDTQLIWQAQHNNITPVSLGECIDTIGPLRDLKSSVNNVGNSSRAILELLRYQEAKLKLS
ncbi:hypothetical protein CIB48_g4465 [Xylaria polymorpha]|nr:hypothetical protein CIB48_g4465 [Xylaria polymorpha]